MSKSSPDAKLGVRLNFLLGALRREIDMEHPTKVTIEITANGWAERVFSGEKMLSERIHIMTSRGSSRAEQKGDVIDDIPDYPELAEEMEDGLGFGPFSIAAVLTDIETEANWETECDPPK